MNIDTDRRRSRRYGIQLKLRWKLMTSQRGLPDQGTGRTVDVSSGGLHFEADCPFPIGETLELSVDWPVMLDRGTPLQLSLSGTIVRSEEKGAAIRIVSHRFRTRSKSGEAAFSAPGYVFPGSVCRPSKVHTL